MALPFWRQKGHVLMGMWAGSHKAFDSLGARIAALGVAAGLDPEVAAAAQDDPDDTMDWRPPCSVCMDRDVQMALTPCFHACFCAVCAIAIREEGAAANLFVI